MIAFSSTFCGHQYLYHSQARTKISNEFGLANYIVICLRWRLFKLTLNPEMAWCHQATSHNWIKRWPRSMIIPDHNESIWHKIRYTIDKCRQEDVHQVLIKDLILLSCFFHSFHLTNLVAAHRHLIRMEHPQLVPEQSFLSPQWISRHHGAVSASNKISYHKISQRFESARSVFRILPSLWNLTGDSAAVLLRRMSNFKSIRHVKHAISWLRNFVRFDRSPSYLILKRSPDHQPSLLD